MPSKLQLLHQDSVTYDEALNKSFDVIQRHKLIHAKNAFTADLWRQRDAIVALTRHHLRLSSGDAVTVEPADKWLTGGFNLCVPIGIAASGSATRKVLLKCPMPYKVAEAQYPGSVEEKVRSEVGAYAWMQQNCPGIRIPQLYGFGFSTHQFTPRKLLPWYRRLFLAFRSWLSRHVFASPLSDYALHDMSSARPCHYLLLEFMGPETGRMLVYDWPKKMDDPDCRKRLLQSLAKIVLDMARVPQPRIGSFRFNDDGTVTLANRAMFAATALLESQGTPRATQEGQTYASTETWVADTLNFFDGNLRADRCASDDADDCRSQMATRTFLHAVAHHFINPEYRDGPFLPQLTDLSAGNFFVDSDWNITCLFDLEWVCALPAEFLEVPYWLTGSGIADLKGDDLATFDKVRQEFMGILKEEEAKIKIAWPLCSIMENSWASNGVWFWHCLSSVDAAYWMVVEHLAEHFSTKITVQDAEMLSRLWARDADKTVETKLEEFGAYAEELKQLFADS